MYFRPFRNFFRNNNKSKLFCIGFNKTGTTSLANALTELGIQVAPQHPAEKLILSWMDRDFSKIIEFTKSHYAFQDVPFSLPFTFIVLDYFWPKSKFILTVRNSAEEWYQSITRFHSKIWGNGEIPTYEQLKNANYAYKGYAWDYIQGTFNTPKDKPYDKNKLIAVYDQHNRNVREYFRNRPKDLLVLNVARKNAFNELSIYLGYAPTKQSFPYKGKTNNI